MCCLGRVISFCCLGRVISSLLPESSHTLLLSYHQGEGREGKGREGKEREKNDRSDCYDKQHIFFLTPNKKNDQCFWC